MSSRPLCALLLCAFALGCDRATPSNDDEVPVTVGFVALDATNTPVVVLEESGGDRSLPIWIGSAEATSIAAEMDDQHFPRPNTHDLAHQLILGLRAELERVVVTELRGSTYYAVIVLSSGGERIEVDSRPSDAIAIALRAHAPIFVRASVFGDAGETAEPEVKEERRIRFHPTPPEEPTGTPPATPALTL